MRDKPECALCLKKKKVKKNDGGEWVEDLVERPNAHAGRHKGKICLFPSHACPFFTLGKV